ncbi:MAG: TIGR01458 family HAD-type hydrolase [Methylophaga sp.]|nr:TIGR01458 family HAD-type hydrolase [Methylophaga sp.]
MIKAILFDISGVLHVDKQALPGAVRMLADLQQSDLQLRFVTNTSRTTSQQTFSSLQNMGFQVKPEQIFTAPGAIRQAVLTRQLRPYFLIHPDLEAEFADIDQLQPNAVVVADAADRFDYMHLNHAFKLLMEGAPLLAIGRNRYFKSGDALQLDAGPFITALEYAANVEAEIFGKPAAGFFQAAVTSLSCTSDEVLMIGDDVEADVLGAMAAGLNACLVQTGKYQPGDENQLQNSNAWLAGDVVAAIQRLQDQNDCV